MSRRSLAVLILCVSAATSRAQNPAAAPQPDIVIPPPPIQQGGPGKPNHQGKMTSEGNAIDESNGHHLHWDCTKRTWIDRDDMSREIGYEGYRGENGEIIPPPSPHPTLGTQAVQSQANPAHAVDAKSGLDLDWDAEDHVWKVRGTSREIPAQGWIVKKCPEIAKTEYERMREDEFYEKQKAQLDKFGEEWSDTPTFQIDLQFEHRDFFKWIEVPKQDPSVSSASGTSTTNGFGGSFGFRIGNLPFYPYVGGYWAGGLELDAMLTNGQRAHSDVDDYGLGVGIRYPISITDRFILSPDIAAYFEKNKSRFQQYNNLNTLIFEEDRTHTTWTGSYGVSATYWANPSIGVSAGAAYNGVFNKKNANENVKLGIAIDIRVGK